MSFLSFEAMYIAFSAVTAFAIWLQIWLLRRNQGKMPNTTFFHVLSLLDSLWVPISVVALFFLNFSNLAMTIPVAYIIYTVLGWIYVAKIIRSSDVVPMHPEDVVFDGRYLSFCQSFALVFFGLCVVVLLMSQGDLSFVGMVT